MKNTGRQTKAETSAAQRELMALMSQCMELDAEVKYCPQYRCFTVMVWRGWDAPDPQSHAKELQMKVKGLSEQYPHVICYCFDEYSTMLYII